MNAVLEDTATNKTVRGILLAGQLQEGPLALAAKVGLELDPSARTPVTQNPEALREYTTALQATDFDTTVGALKRSVAADPDYGPAYVQWLRASIGRGDRESAERVASMARARGEGIGVIERAQLEATISVLTNDPSAQLRSLKALSDLTPADVDLMVNLAEAEVRRRDCAAGAETYEQATRLEPSYALLWNALGYARAFAGDLNGARESLETYQRLDPEEANPLDSLGDVHYYRGRFADAEKYYLQSYEKDPSFGTGASLYKAARARLMTGDIPGAQAIFQQYAETLRALNSPTIELLQAQWEYLSGQTAKASLELEQLVRSRVAPPDVISIAYSQLSTWTLVSGDTVKARAYATQAISAARTAATRNLAKASLFLTGPKDSASTLAQEAARVFPEPAQSDLGKSSLAYALLLGGHFEEAVSLLRELRDQSPPDSAEPLGTLLAWALVETSREQEIGDLLDTFATPRTSGDHILTFLAFPKVFRLRALMLEKQGREEEARSDNLVFQKLGGNR